LICEFEKAGNYHYTLNANASGCYNKSNPSIYNNCRIYQDINLSVEGRED